MLNEQQLLELRKGLHTALPIMAQAAATIRDEEVSKYPVFVLFREADGAGLGIALLDAAATSSGWQVHVSTLEELASKNIVKMENVERFTAVYKTHTDALCCLVYSDGDAQFVFIPIT
ncbi:MAG: hypothetical protein D6772_16885 [Bacteroidetes bacterium]|nr:MAG: hypothetical protein D6772_16885 [Bacteroidota bacterium]